MEKTFKARFTKGMLEPLEQLTLDEGEEVMVTITAPDEDVAEAGGTSLRKQSLAEQMAANESFRRDTEEGFRQFAEGKFASLAEVKRRLGDV